MKSKKKYVKTEINATQNKTKIDLNSHKIMMKKIESKLENLIEEITSTRSDDKINFEDIGNIFNIIGVFQKLKFTIEESENVAKLELDEVHVMSCSSHSDGA